MSRLDEKLWGVLSKPMQPFGTVVEYNLPRKEIEAMIDQIKQVFAEERTETVADYSNGKLSTLMTGREFYNHFENNLKGKVFPHGDTNRYVANAVNQCLEAARKAAGLTEVGDE